MPAGRCRRNASLGELPQAAPGLGTRRALCRQDAAGDDQPERAGEQAPGEENGRERRQDEAGRSASPALSWPTSAISPRTMIAMPAISELRLEAHSVSFRRVRCSCCSSMRGCCVSSVAALRSEDTTARVIRASAGGHGGGHMTCEEDQAGAAVAAPAKGQAFDDLRSAVALRLFSGTGSGSPAPHRYDRDWQYG